MSWWDTSSFSSFASNALKTAQQRIDKVLDIKDEEGETAEGAGGDSKLATTKPPKDDTDTSKGGDFWSSYLGTDAPTGFTSTPSKSKSVSKPTARTAGPSQGSQQSPVSSSEWSELKTSATSAFTVRSKRVESVLKNYQVKAEATKVGSTEKGESKVEKKLEKSQSSAELEKSVAAPEAQESNVDASQSSAVTKEEITISKEQKQHTKSQSPDSSQVEDKRDQTAPKKSGPLRLGSKISKKKESEEKKKDEQEKEKEQKEEIEEKVEQLLDVELKSSSKDHSENSSKSESIDCTDSQQSIVSQTDTRPTETVDNEEKDRLAALEPTASMIQSGEGSGWEEEELDIDDIIDDKEPELPAAEIKEHKNEEAESTEQEQQVKESESVTDNVSESVVKSGKTEVVIEEKVAEVKMDESNQSVEVIDAAEVNEDTTYQDAQVKDSIPETISNSTVTEPESEPDKTDAAEGIVEPETSSESKISESSIAKEGEESLKSDVNEPVDTITTEVSFDSSDTTEPVGDDQLSESSRTLTGDDFRTPHEEEQQQPEQQQQTLKEKDKEEQESESNSPKTSPRSSFGESEQQKSAEGDKKTGSLVSSSYVKTMLEEAMTESVKDTDSHSSSASDKSSEMVRIESGLNSGHTSGDEIDTTTSSDIEIISTPTPNGEYRQERPFDLSPLRHALSRTMRRGSPPGHKRSDSSSSAHSTWSKNGDDLLSPEGGAHRDGDGSMDTKRDDHHRKEHTLEELQEKGDAEEQESSNPLETQTLLKDNGSLEEVLPSPTHQLNMGQGLQTIAEKVEPSENSLDAKSVIDKPDSLTSKDLISVTAPPDLQEDKQGIEEASPSPADQPNAGHDLQTVQKMEPIKDSSEASIINVDVSSLLLSDLSSVTTVSKLLKEADDTDNPIELHQKLAEMAEILEAREKKLVELSRENIDLQESKAILKNQLQQSEEARETELEDLNTVSEEFTARISEFEQKVQHMARERDALKKQLSEAQNEVTKKGNSNSSMERLMREKDQQVSELLEEGEKLSKQQLQSNNIIKKLRAKEKDNDALLKSHKQKLEQQTEELNHLRMVLDAKEEVEKKQIEAINQQNSALKKQEAELSQLRLELEDMQEKARGLQAALDNSYKEISELHKANAAAASETATAKLSVEMSAKQELQLAMERQTLSHKQQLDALVSQIEDLQLSMVRQEREHGRREDVLRQEISDLQQRLQEAEERNQDLTQSVTSATRPLLRQIENLQSTYTAQSGSYEKVERNLTDRLHEAQNALAEAVEKERAASERLMDVSTRLTSLETQISTLRQEKSHLQAQLEVEKTKIMVLEDAKNNESAQLAVMKAKFSEEITDLKKEKVLLENQVEMEKMRVEAERKKLTLAHEQIRDKELQLQRQGMTPSPASVTQEESLSGESTSTQMTTSMTQEDILEKTLLLGSANGSKANLYETLRRSGAATLVENLQSQLKMKEGEIVQLQNDIGELERTREAMARELVNLTTRNDKLQDQLEEYPELKKAHGELDSRYNALLQMYGEKVEEADELNMDLQDIKDMYKAQIEELLKRVR